MGDGKEIKEIHSFENQWIWHPDWDEAADTASAGGFVHFRKSVNIAQVGAELIRIQITADTRYRLYINKRLVHFGPVKGDEGQWFYDELDVQPYLLSGENHIAVHVLRFYYSSTYAPAFARLPFGGFWLRMVDPSIDVSLATDSSWETAIDPSAFLRTDEKYDDFLNVFEKIDRRNDAKLSWVASKTYKFMNSCGITSPWKLSPRQIPFQRLEPTRFHAVHNVRSSVGTQPWKDLLVTDSSTPVEVRLPAGSSHHVELEVEKHLTALLAFRFGALTGAGSTMTITYSECYEDAPMLVPYIRRKGNRCDDTKSLVGPQDIYTLGGQATVSFGYDPREQEEEIFQPFHFRTLRYLALDIVVSKGAELVVRGIDIIKSNYPLQVLADINVGESWVDSLWDISNRTLVNCMHDCYEDCPFYEQLQYAMDTRSSCLFTYLTSRDDRLARQAIRQLHNSFQPAIGLTCARAPCHNIQRQIIPNFSLYWVCMVTDHYEYFADKNFIRPLLSVCNSVLDFFADRLDPELGLVRACEPTPFWEYTDWTTFWVPHGIPPALARTGFSTYTNLLYAYTLKRLSSMLRYFNRDALAGELGARAEAVVMAVRAHCYDGEFFTDGLASKAVITEDYSQHNQVWAVLAGASTGIDAERILNESLARGNPETQSPAKFDSNGERLPPTLSSKDTDPKRFTIASISFAFYTMRALAAAEGNVYQNHFYRYLQPWRDQVANNLTTWAEDNVSVRSDCHAWGSTPIYEFTHEIAGVKPAAPGWQEITFQPRLSLFSSLEAKVPFCRLGKAGLALVKWKHAAESRPEKLVVAVELKLTDDDGEALGDVTVHVVLPDGRKESVKSSSSLEYIVQLKSS